MVLLAPMLKKQLIFPLYILIHFLLTAELEPTNSHAYKNMALLFIEEGNIKEACKQFQKAVDYGYLEDYDDDGELQKLLDQHCK